MLRTDPVAGAQGLISPSRLIMPWHDALAAAAIIDLADVPVGSGPPELPPFPVIGIGTRDRGWADSVDVLVPGISEAMAICDACERHPEPARVLVQLLRLIERLPLSDALVAESLAFGLLQAGADHRRWLAARKPQPVLPPGELHMSRTADALALVIDRPDARNGIDRAMRDALRQAFDVAVLDDEICAVTLRAVGRTFSTGADLAEFGTTLDPVAAHAIRMQTLPAHALAKCGHKLAVHVHGACIGSGLEMAAFAGHVTASMQAWFQLPELSMGLIPGAGGCVSLVGRIGRQETARLVLTGRRISARDGLAIGLVDALVDDDGSA